MRKKIILLTLFLYLISCIAAPTACVSAAGSSETIQLTAKERAYLKAHSPLRVGYVQDRIPISFTGRNGELDGFSRYIFDRIAKISGTKFDYVPLPAGSITYDFLMEEHLDLVTSVEYNKENLNAKGIAISSPYLSSRKVIVARPDLTFDSSKHLKVAVSTGSQTLRKVLQEIYPNFKLKDYASITDCFDAVRSGEADLLIQNQYVVEYWISRPAYEKLKVIPVLGLEDELCFSVVFSFDGTAEPTEADGRLLIGILNKAIGAISEDEIGSYTIQSVMENQYEYSLSDILYRYRFSFFVFLVSVAIICVLVSLLLRQRIRSIAAQADARAKGQFLSTMSHEIRTPLNGLIGLNYLISRNLDDRVRLESYLKQSTNTAHYLLSLVNDILDMSRLQEHRMELLCEPVDLNLTISTAASLVGSAMSEKSQDFVVETDLTDPWILGDAVRIQQVILNLLDNARKFTPESGRIFLKTGQSPAPDGKVLTRITVADTGRGMSEEFQKRIFRSFSQELETVSKGNQGTGLGLSISRELANLMDGDITFTSRKGEGSQFVFTFAAKPTEMRKKPEEERPYRMGPSLRILVAEDNELNGEIMIDLLEDQGFEVVLAKDGREALQFFSDSAPYSFDIILMDIMMPKLDGFEATKAIRALNREDAKTVHIIACTANAFAEEHRKAIESGMNDFMAKPVDIENLLEKIDALRGS